MGRISYFQMEISLGRWNTKLFLGRRSYLLSKKKGIQKNPRLFEKYFSLKHALPRPAGNRTCGFFLKTSNLIVLGRKKQEVDVLRKLEAPSSQSKNKEKIREIETIQTNESYHTMFQSNLRCPEPPGIEPAVFFLKTSNLSLLAAKKSKRASWEKVWWLDFLKTSNLSFYIRRNMVYSTAKNRAQIGRLEKIEPPNLSQDALFGLFGRQKTQIGRLEKIKDRNCGSFAVGDWNRVRAIPGLTVHFLVSFAFNGFYCRKLVSNSLLAQKDFSMAGFDIKKTN